MFLKHILWKRFVIFKYIVVKLSDWILTLFYDKNSNTKIYLITKSNSVIFYIITYVHIAEKKDIL